MSTAQVTVAVTVAGCPIGVVKPSCVDAYLGSGAVDVLVGQAAGGGGVGAGLGGALGAGDGGGSGGLGGGGVHGLGGDGDPAGEQDQADEEQERGQADRGLEHGRPALVPVRRAGPHRVIRSTVTVADWVTGGAQCGMTVSGVPRTVMVAVVVLRDPVTCAAVRASPAVAVR